QIGADSGYNLVASMRRDGRHLIGVVLGEKSNAARNARMRQLIEEHLSQAASTRTAASSVPATQDHLPLRTYIGVETKGADLGQATPWAEPTRFGLRRASYASQVSVHP